MASFVRIKTPQLAKLDARQLNVAMKKELESAFNIGIGAFVDTLASRIHLQTGESFASLQPLAEEIGKTIFPSAGGTGFKRKDTLNRQTGARIKDTSPRGDATGRSLGLNAFNISISAVKLTFTFVIPTFQFSIHNAGVAGSGAMKGALQDAELTMLLLLREVAFPAIDTLVSNWFLTGRARPRLI